jgi:hypothetical protein
MTKDEALKMAIEALLYGTDHTKAVKACKEALAEQPNRQDEARERWLDQLADECSDPNL